MPTTYEEVRDRLSRKPLPTELEATKVDAVMRELGYARHEGKGSHVLYRKPGAPTRTFAIDRRRVGKAAVAALAYYIQTEGR